MKHVTILTIALLMVVLSSCSVTKKAVSESKTESHDQTQVDKQSDSTATSKKTIKDSLLVNITEEQAFSGEKIEYAHDKPIDPNTGLPPVKSKTTFYSESYKDTKIEKGSESESKDSSTVTEVDNSKLDVDTKEHIETELVKKRGSLW